MLTIRIVLEDNILIFAVVWTLLSESDYPKNDFTTHVIEVWAIGYGRLPANIRSVDTR